ncbi:hypothetical protein Hypma_012315 [Hypsizygus marmoreus]|uniref:Uncharacterized protein n=1 Tax=Hypsizygus marmoreus TaxID=39966 RepID=A0A369JJ72_HYPMA|nr:hypothetical protein Hypma_012315 [Hypsizygus marmoreus]
MIADFVSADMGWLRSKDGTHNPHRVMKPGKNRDRYFMNEDILEQANEAMDICKDDYPEYEHVFVYDNAPSHLKRAEESLSARKMPRNLKTWLIQITKCDAQGNPVYNADGTYQKVDISMCDATFNGQPQPLYFHLTHPRAGEFKGMAQILEERGFETKDLLAQCKDFKCAPPALDCCCRQLLFNQPDFQDGETLLKATCRARESSHEDILVTNVLAALDAVPLESMRWFAIRSCRFMHAYSLRLNRRQAAWASRKYRGHRVLLETILADLEKASMH